MDVLAYKHKQLVRLMGRNDAVYDESTRWTRAVLPFVKTERTFREMLAESLEIYAANKEALLASRYAYWWPHVQKVPQEGLAVEA